MNTELLLNIIQSVLTTVLIPLLGWGVSTLVNFLNSKINNAKIEKYITFAGQVVESVVKETSQTYVNSLKESGKFDGDIVLVRPIEFGNLDMFHKQDCQYTVCLRGIVDGEPKVIKRVVTSVADAVDAYNEYQKYSDYAKL